MNCPPRFDKFLLHPKFWPTWFGVALFWPFSLLPISLRHKVGAGFGVLAYKYNAKRRRIVRANLRACFPEFSNDKIKQISKQHFKYAAIGIFEASVHVFASKRRLKKMLLIDNEDFLSKTVGKQGVLLLLAHSTFLDFIAVGTANYQAKGSYNPFKNKVVDYLVQYARCRFASGLIKRAEGLRPLVRELNNHRLVVYLPDEDFGFKHSVMARFFAMKKATLSIPARLIKLTGAMAIPLMIVWDVKLKKYRMKALAPLQNYPSGEVEQDARILNKALEELIEPDIAQYMWTLKIFKTRPDKERAIY